MSQVAKKDNNKIHKKTWLKMNDLAHKRPDSIHLATRKLLVSIKILNSFFSTFWILSY